MDFQRIILVGALAVIGYVMALQWQKDYAPQDMAQEPVTSISSQSVGSDSAIADVAPSKPSDNSDLVSHADINAEEDVAEKSLTSAKPGQLISVTTDVLSLKIDPIGGDVIHAELNDYLAKLGNEQKLVLLSQNDTRVYTAQSALMGRDGIDAKGRAQYQSATLNYDLSEGQDELQVDLIAVQDNGVKVTKRFTFTRGSYVLNVQYLVDNASDQPWQGKLLGQIKRDHSPDPTSQSGMGMSSYLGPAFSNSETPYEKYSFDDIDDDGKYSNKSDAGWVAMLQHYFVSAWIPNEEQTHNYFALKRNDNYLAGFISPAFDVAPGQQGSTSAKFYVGPKSQDILENTAKNLNLVVDYGILWWIAQPLFAGLTFMQSIFINWGVAIIMLTVVIKALFFWPSAIAYRSMAKMRTLGPEMQRLKDLYGDDKQKMSQSMMELYKKEKINPLGGCLPMLVQMPVFIALYWVLMESVELRQAPFILWIKDMSVMDPYFILPILMGASMFCQQMLNPTPPDPMQAKVMKMLPIIFTVFFLWFPAGLVLYWLVNNLLSIAQQWIITRQIEAAAAAKKG